MRQVGAVAAACPPPQKEQLLDTPLARPPLQPAPILQTPKYIVHTYRACSGAAPCFWPRTSRRSRHTQASSSCGSCCCCCCFPEPGRPALRLIGTRCTCKKKGESDKQSPVYYYLHHLLWNCIKFTTESRLLMWGGRLIVLAPDLVSQKQASLSV